MVYEQVNREIYVTVGPLSQPTGTKFQNLKMSLNLTKSADTKNNNGTIKIYNLKHDSIQELTGYKEKLGVTVEAGYNGNANVVFIGIIMGMHVEYTGTDVVLNIKVVDGVFRAANIWFSKSYGKNTDPCEILADVMYEMLAVNDKLSIGKFSCQLATSPYKNGFVWNGFAGDCLTRICADKGLKWFISDDVIHILGNEESIQPGLVPFLTPVSGLVGSPRYHEEKTGKRKDKHTEKGIKFRCLLNPELKVGTEVKIRSRFFDDHYLIKKIVISADNRDGEFIMEVVAINEWL